MLWEGSDPIGVRELECLEEKGLERSLGVSRVRICSLPCLRTPSMLCYTSDLMLFWNGEAFLSYNRVLQKDPCPGSLKLMLANEKYAQPWLWGTGGLSNGMAIASPHSSVMACPTDLSWSRPVVRELLGSLYAAGKNVPCFHRAAVCWYCCLGWSECRGIFPQQCVVGSGSQDWGAGCWKNFHRCWMCGWGLVVVVAWGGQNKR